jgi:hypothetical protein
MRSRRVDPYPFTHLQNHVTDLEEVKYERYKK